MTIDRSVFLAARGTPHSILLALLLAGPQTAAGLADYCRLDRRTVATGLALLEDLAVVVLEGDRWAVPAAGVAAFGGNAGSESGKEGDATRTNSVSASSSSSSSSCDRSDLVKTVKEEGGGGRGRWRANTSAADSARVFDLLLEAGVGRRSAKMLELMSLGLSPVFVEAHGRDRQRRLEAGEEVPVGYLIQSLVDGDPAPVDVEAKERQRREALYTSWGVMR